MEGAADENSLLTFVSPWTSFRVSHYRPRSALLTSSLLRSTRDIFVLTSRHCQSMPFPAESGCDLISWSLRLFPLTNGRHPSPTVAFLD
jgi:hypothetical protein